MKPVILLAVVGWLGLGVVEGAEIPANTHQAYFGERPKSFLVDPQRLLGRAEFRDQLEFLEYHASDSSVDLYVYLFDADQQLPAGFQADKCVDELFASGKPAVVIHYFLGQPQRAALYLCPALDDVVSLAEQGRALEMAVAEAAEDGVAVGQLGKFLVQMSIRMYWMERLLEKRLVQGGGEPMDGEIVPKPTLPAEQPPSPREQAEAVLRRFGPGVGIVLLVLAGLGVARWQVRRRARYRFVDLEVEPRLGGAHAAGVGAVISFASAAVPPAAQKQR